MERCDVIILGAGAAGMAAAVEAGRRGRRVILLDHARAPGEKIRISGGGRCNFTNLHITPDTIPARLLSQNPRFALSALSRYTQHDFIARVSAAGIRWHEKTLGQLFCAGSAQQIIAMLRAEMAGAGVDLRLSVQVTGVHHDWASRIETDCGVLAAPALVVATGGKSIPKMGATGLGYRIAEQFGLRLTETRPALVPLTFADSEGDGMAALAGLSVSARVACDGAAFDEGLLFTHHGLSGPSILQISSCWREDDPITVDLARGQDIASALAVRRQQAGRMSVKNAVAGLLPESLTGQVVARAGVAGNLADQSKADLDRPAEAVHRWQLTPAGFEGYRTAEVMMGGLDTRDLDSRTLAARRVPGLYFIVEVVDVTGWLGGYNFQWA